MSLFAEPDVDKPEPGMWKFCPEMELSIDDSTDGNGSFASRTCGDGGVRAFCNGDAWYCCCIWPGRRKPGGKDDCLAASAFIVDLGD